MITTYSNRCRISCAVVSFSLSIISWYEDGEENDNHNDDDQHNSTHNSNNGNFQLSVCIHCKNGLKTTLSIDDYIIKLLLMPSPPTCWSCSLPCSVLFCAIETFLSEKKASGGNDSFLVQLISLAYSVDVFSLLVYHVRHFFMNLIQAYNITAARD